MSKVEKKKISIILGLMCLLLTAGICIQIRTINGTNTAYSTNEKINRLKNEVLKTKEKYDNTYSEVEYLEKKLEVKREKITNSSTQLEELEQKIKKLNKIIGYSEVTGPGIILKFGDSAIKASSYIGNEADLIIHDFDLINIVNELKNMGAEAISVNDQRIVSTTSIECDGNVIKINGEKIGAPFEIKAIGFPEQLAGIDRQGGYLDVNLIQWGFIIEINKEEEITIPKYSGTISSEFIEN